MPDERKRPPVGCPRKLRLRPWKRRELPWRAAAVDRLNVDVDVVVLGFVAGPVVGQARERVALRGDCRVAAKGRVGDERDELAVGRECGVAMGVGRMRERAARGVAGTPRVELRGMRMGRPGRVRHETAVVALVRNRDDVPAVEARRIERLRHRTEGRARHWPARVRIVRARRRIGRHEIATCGIGGGDRAVCPDGEVAVVRPTRARRGCRDDAHRRRARPRERVGLGAAAPWTGRHVELSVRREPRCRHIERIGERESCRRPAHSGRDPHVGAPHVLPLVHAGHDDGDPLSIGRHRRAAEREDAVGVGGTECTAAGRDRGVVEDGAADFRRGRARRRGPRSTADGRLRVERGAARGWEEARTERDCEHRGAWTWCRRRAERQTVGAAHDGGSGRRDGLSYVEFVRATSRTIKRVGGWNRHAHPVYFSASPRSYTATHRCPMCHPKTRR